MVLGLYHLDHNSHILTLDPSGITAPGLCKGSRHEAWVATFQGSPKAGSQLH